MKIYILQVLPIAAIMAIIIGGCSQDDVGPNNSQRIPMAPSDLIVQSKTTTTVTLGWKDNSDNEHYFYIYRFDDTSCIQVGTADSNQTGYVDRGLRDSASYSYYIAAANYAGNSASDTISVFTLVSRPPGPPSNPNPPDGSVNVSVVPDLKWDCTDPDGDSLTYIYYLDTAPDPGLYPYDYMLEFNTTYYWKVIAKDVCEDYTTGPIWHFSTESPLFVLDTLFGVSDYPRFSCLTDVDGDGDKDVVVVQYGADMVLIFRSNGDGSFAKDYGYSVGQAPASVASADINGDGFNDLITANYVSNNISILINRGDGTFEAAPSYDAGIFPSSVVCGDFNNDNNMDIAVTCAGSNYVAILMNNGNGDFQAPAICPTGSEPASLVASDFDNDGDIDLAVANPASSNISILKNNGDGSFASAINLAVGNAPTSVRAYDIENDGGIDLLITFNYYNKIVLLKNSGAGTFENPMEIEIGQGEWSLRDVCIADFDNDGDKDIVIALGEFSSHSGSFCFVENNGDGTFWRPIYYDSGEHYGSCVMHNDTDSDGDEDIIMLLGGIYGHIAHFRNLTF